MTYDLAIIGGGMVGAALACALRDTPLKIILVDAAESHANDHRLIALNHTSCQFFETLRIWPTLAPHAAKIDEVHVSSRGHFGRTRLTAHELALTYLGYVVPAKEINLALYAQLAELKNVTLLRGAKVTGLTEESITVTRGEEQQIIPAAFFAAADGTFSTVRDLLHIPTDIIDYQQKALVTTTELARSHHHIAYERFLPDGAIAMLPLTGMRVATIWSGPQAKIDELMQRPLPDFLSALQQQFGYRLGKLKKIRERFTYPLKYVKAERHIQGRFILLGNAAHTVHPIAAQGLNLALYEVAVLAKHFSETLSLKNLPDFLSQQAMSVTMSHQLTRIFSWNFLGANTLRQVGMIGLDLCSALKKRLGEKIV